MKGFKDKEVRWIRILKELDKTEKILLLMVIAGALLRIATVWTQQPRYDGTAYMAEANSLAQGLGFTGPWGRYDDPFSSTPQPTNLGPVYPLYLSAFYRFAGFSIGVTKFAGTLLAFLVLAVTYLTGKDLYGRFAGLLGCAILSVNPLLITFPAWEQADSLPVLFGMVAIWGLIRGTRQRDWLPLFVAGLGAALFALTKAQGLGLGIVLAVVAGFIGWWLLEYGKRSLGEPGILAFVAAFLGPILPWLAWGPHVDPPPPVAAPSFTQVVVAGAVKLGLVVYGLAFTLAFLLPELARVRNAVRTQEGRVLWLSGLGLCAIVWLLLVADYAAGNVPGSPWRTEQVRHLLPALVPCIWLVCLPHGDGISQNGEAQPIRLGMRWIITLVLLSLLPLVVWFGTFVDGLLFVFLAVAVHIRPTRQRIVLLLALSLLVAANSAFDIHRSPEDSAGLWLQAHAKSGNLVALDPWTGAANGTIPSDGPAYKYELYPYLGGRNVSVVPYESGVNATFILSWRSSNFTGYTLVGAYGWESQPGPFTLAWAWILETGSRALGRGTAVTIPAPSAWLFERA